MSIYEFPKSPIVSIIIPVYNVQEYIEECLHSVFEQTYRKIEVIIIDDCGTDASIQTAVTLLEKQTLPWRLVHHERNRGLSAARNTGASQAKGDYIYFLDSDDVLTPKCISSLVNEALSTQAEMTFGQHQCFHDLRNLQLIHEKEFRAEKDSLKAYITQTHPPMACNRLILLEWYQKTGVKFIDGLLHEDEPWSLSLALRCKKIAYVNEITYLYRQREGSIMHSSKNQKERIRSRLFILEHAFKELYQYYASAWPKECLMYYSEFQWALANDIHTLNEAGAIPQLRLMFSQVRIPSFNSPNILIRLFFYMRIFIPQYLAYYLIVSLYKFIISIRTRIRKYI